MPKNKGKGGKKYHRSKGETDDVKRELMLKEDGQSYAQVTRILGNGHIEAFCFDNIGGKTRICRIRGKLRKKVWIQEGDIILIGLRNYQDDKADVITKYYASEARKLIRMQEIPDIHVIDIGCWNVEDDVTFIEDFNDKRTNNVQSLSCKAGNQKDDNGNLSESESENDDEDSYTFYKSNQLPKMSGNLNARNLLQSTKHNGKDVISESDSETNDDFVYV